MVSALGQADSFNSSGATIMPDRNEEGPTRHQTRSRLSAVAQRQGTQVLNRDVSSDRTFGRVPSMVAQARMLMPQDSFGRELAAMANGGDTGMTEDDWSFLATSSGDASSANSHPTRELTFSQLLDVPSSPPAEATNETSVLSESDMEAINHFESHFPPNSFTADTSQANIFRPSSAHSNFRPSSAHSNTASEYSFSSTDVETDSVMSDANPQPQSRNDRVNEISLGAMNMDSGPSAPQTHFWVNQHQQGSGWEGSSRNAVKGEANWDELRTVAPESVSPQDGESSTGPVRNSEDPNRLVRLEHRRQINRKSAQKHRKRRKEELEILSQQVAERDHKITQLEKDLAVERAKIGQLVALIKSRGMNLGGDGAAW